MVPERTEVYAGVDVSKERLEICVRRGREGKEDEHTFGVSNDPAGTQRLLGRLLEERPALVILEATGGFERPVAAALAAAGLPIAVVNARQARDFARATVRAALYMGALLATRHNPQIKEFYERLLGAGKPRKVALVACMRKLLIILNAMLKNHTTWNSPQTLAP
jgi:transposase